MLNYIFSRAFLIEGKSTKCIVVHICQLQEFDDRTAIIQDINEL